VNSRRTPLRFPPYLIFDTGNRDEVRDALVNNFGASDFDLRHGGENFRGIGNLLRLKHLDLCYCYYSADVHVTFPAGTFVKQQLALCESGRTTFGRTQFGISTDETGVVPAGTEASHDYSANLSQLVLRIDASALQSKLAALSGRPVGRNIEFSTPATFKNPLQLRLRRLIKYFIGEIDRKGANFSDLEFADFEQLLMVSFLTANLHNFTGLLEARTPSAGPWQVRIVEEYIAANWNQPITIESLAEATGVGVRSLFHTFKEARGYSPMSFLKRIRLEHARRMLQAPDDTTSVTTVGRACGFHNAGHFAHDYRRAFCELPSTTLAVARRALRAAKPK